LEAELHLMASLLETAGLPAIQMLQSIGSFICQLAEDDLREFHKNLTR
jgi:hypothetical protein